MTTAEAATMPSAMHSAMHEARQLHIALDVDGRPHVTPELFTWSGGKVWFASAPSTFKSRHLEPGDAVAAVVRLPARDLLVRGTVERFQASEIGRHGLRSLEAAAATARFAVRNAGDLLAFAGDAITGRGGRRLPQARVLYALEPEAAVLTENDVVIEDWCWGATRHEHPAAPERGGARAVAAFPGPAALAAQWFEERSELRISGGVLDLYDIDERTAVAVVLDDYGAPGPAAKSGSLLHGAARVEEPGVLRVEVERRVGWDGVMPVSGDRA